jgi:hypothetical protein
MEFSGILKNVLFVVALAVLIWYSIRVLGLNAPEQFTCPGNIVFMRGCEAAKFLIADQDNYVQTLTPTDLYARNAKSNDGYKLASARAAVDFTPKQQEIYTRAAADADAALLKLGHEIIVAMQWRFAMTQGDVYEMGWPHTRANIIWVSTQLDTYPYKKLVKTLVHEKIHLFQRAYPEKLANMLNSVGYIRWKHRVGVPRIRANPDLDPWIYIDPKTQKPMLALYNSDTPADIGDVDTAPEDEHPYERIAYEVADKAI